MLLISECGRIEICLWKKTNSLFSIHLLSFFNPSPPATHREKALKFNTYLVPASWYELSQIKYDQGDLKECKRCLKKVNSFGSYFGEGLISFRVNLMTEKLKNTKVSSPDVKS